MLTHPWLIRNPIFRKRLVFTVRLLRGHFKPKVSERESDNSGLRAFGILSIAVHPNYQGIAAAKLLMNETERIARKLGFKSMQLSVRPENRKAVNFYEHLGWTKNKSNGYWLGKYDEKSFHSVNMN